MRPHLFPQNQLDSSSNDFETPKSSKAKKRKAEDMEDFDSSNSTFDDTPPAPGLRARIKGGGKVYSITIVMENRFETIFLVKRTTAELEERSILPQFQL